MQVKFTIEPESGFALVQWMTKEGYADAAAELIRELGKHYDTIRCSQE